MADRERLRIQQYAITPDACYKHQVSAQISVSSNQLAIGNCCPE